MGDRCYWRARVSADTASLFEEIIRLQECEIDREEGRWIEYEVDAANYGYYMQMEDAAKQGCAFEGYSGPGGDYSAILFASKDGVLHTAAEVDGRPAVRVDLDGKIVQADLDGVLDYLRALKAVAAAIGEKVAA